MANNLTNTKQQSLAPKKESFSNFINGKVGQALTANAISDPIKRSRFVTSLITLVSNNPALRECDYSTLISAGLQAESLELPINNQLGLSYIIPYKNNKLGRIEAQFQCGYRGFLQSAIRSNQMKKIHVVEVKEGELVKFNPILNEFEFSYITNPSERVKAPVIGYYTFFETINGYVQELYWTKEQMEEHAITYSQGYKAKKGYTFWEKNFDGMAKKTMLKQILKFAPLSVDSPLAKALAVDQAVIREDGTLDYVDGNDYIDTEIVEKETTVIEENVKSSDNKQEKSMKELMEQEGLFGESDIVVEGI